MASTRSVIESCNLIKKVYFPRQTLPLATVLFNFAQFLLALAVFIPIFLLFSPIPVYWLALGLFPLLALHLLFTIGVALLLSALTSSFRDVEHLTEVGLVLLFWVTPIIYPLSMVPVSFQKIMMLNPLASLAVAYQDLLFYGRVPEIGVIVTLLLWTAGLFTAGTLIFKWYDPSLAELV